MGQFGLKKLLGQRPAGVFVLVEGGGLVLVFDGVGEEPGGDRRVVQGTAASVIAAAMWRQRRRSRTLGIVACDAG
jgi:hypothetical protein